MPKIIQDSDDEASMSAISTPDKVKTCELGSSGKVSASNGTGSTGLLERGIREAHDDLLSLSPGGNVRNDAGPLGARSGDGDEPKSKRRKTTDCVDLNEKSSQKSAQRSTTITYSTSMSQSEDVVLATHAERSDHAEHSMQDEGERSLQLPPFPDFPRTAENDSSVQRNLTDGSRANISLRSQIDVALDEDKCQSAIVSRTHNSSSPGPVFIEPQLSHERPASGVLELASEDNLVSEVSKGKVLDELSGSADNIEPLAVKGPKTRTRKQTQPNETRGRKIAENNLDFQASDELNSDEVAVGLPRERYQPRPSRSRSSRIELDIIDPFVKPERAAKIRSIMNESSAEVTTIVDEQSNPVMHPIKQSRSTKANLRRTRTYDASLGPSTPATSQKLQCLTDMGFSPTRAITVLEQRKGNLDEAVDVLVASVPADSSGNGVTVNEPSSSRNESTHTSAAIGPQKEKKRGRGRPRSKNQVLEIEERKEIQEHDKACATPAKVVPSEEVDDKASRHSLENLNTNKSTTSEKPKADRTELSPTTPPSASLNVANVQENTLEASRGNPPEEHDNPIPSRHSPISASKVPFRVGLSRRARIAPLLRVKKK